MQRSLCCIFNFISHSSHIGIASNLPTTAYVKMIDVFMIFTMTVPLMEIIGHTYGESLRMEISELNDLPDHPKAPHGLGSPPGSVSIQPLGLDDPKLDIPQIKSELFANDKRSEFNFFRFILQDFDFDNVVKKGGFFQKTLGAKDGTVCLLPGRADTYCCNRSKESTSQY